MDIDIKKERETVERRKPYIVWERHCLSDKQLGEIQGDVPHYFWTYEKARTFMTTVMKLHPNYSEYVRILGFNTYCQGYDFGSWSDFLILESKSDPLPGFDQDVE